MIDTELLDWHYYLKKFSSFLKDDGNVVEMFKTKFDLLKLIDTNADNLFYLLDIFGVSFKYSKDRSIPEQIEEKYANNNILEVIASIYGITPTITLKDAESGTSEIVTVTKYELFCLIGMKIVNINYNGNISTLNGIYKKLNLPITAYYNCRMTTYFNLPSFIPGTQTSWESTPYTQHIVKMYENDMFTPNVLGLKSASMVNLDELQTIWPDESDPEQLAAETNHWSGVIQNERRGKGQWNI